MLEMLNSTHFFSRNGVIKGAGHDQGRIQNSYAKGAPVIIGSE